MVDDASAPFAGHDPAFALPLADGRSLTLESFAGQPLVLVFLDDSSRLAGAGSETLERARGELRGLGAALLAVSPHALWCFRADDETQVFAVADDVALARLRERFGVPGEGAGVFVLDVVQDVRFTWIAAEPSTTFTSVVDALAEAGRALVVGRRARFTRRQLLLGVLVAAFASTLADGCHVPPPVAAAWIATLP